MIEARLVEVTANPKQSYGINWAGVVGSSTQRSRRLRTAGPNATRLPARAQARNVPHTDLQLWVTRA